MFSNTKETSINLEKMIDLLAESNAEPITLGGCTSYRISHPQHGEMILIQTPVSDECLAFSV